MISIASKPDAHNLLTVKIGFSIFNPPNKLPIHEPTISVPSDKALPIHISSIKFGLSFVS